MTLADIAADENNVANALIFARFCQQIAADLGSAADAAFTAGLLDAVGAPGAGSSHASAARPALVGTSSGASSPRRTRSCWAVIRA